MAEINGQGLEPVSGLDAAFLRMDHPDSWAIINILLVIADPIDIACLRQLIRSNLLSFSRFSFRIVAADGGLWWQRDRSLDVDRHVRVQPLASGIGRNALCRWLEDTLATPLAADRPGWEFIHLPDYGPGGAILARIHHVYGDGRSMARVLATLAGVVPPRAGRAEDDTASAFRDDPAHLRRLPTANATGPWDFLRKLWTDMRTLAKLATLPKDRGTGFDARPDLRRRVAFSDPISEAGLRRAAQRLGCRAHEAVLSAVAGALRASVTRSGVDPARVRYKVSIPVDLHAMDSVRAVERRGRLGNLFGSVLLELPLGISDPAARIQAIRRSLRAALASNEAHMTYKAMCRFQTEPPDAVRKLMRSGDHLASGIVSTLVGPSAPGHLAGCRIEQTVFWAPTPRLPGTALGVGVLSYAGHVQFGVTVAANAPLDADAFLRDLAAEVAMLVAAHAA